MTIEIETWYYWLKGICLRSYSAFICKSLKNNHNTFFGIVERITNDVKHNRIEGEFWLNKVKFEWQCNNLSVIN